MEMPWSWLYELLDATDLITVYFFFVRVYIASINLEYHEPVIKQRINLLIY